MIGCAGTSNQGRSPYCHGWEVRDQAIGILASGPMAVHQALLFRQLTADLTLFVHTAPRPADEEAEQLAARGIAVVEGEVASLEVHEDRLAGVRLQNGEVISRGAVVVGPRFAARGGMLAGLGLATTTHPSGMGEHIEADDERRGSRRRRRQPGRAVLGGALLGTRTGVRREGEPPSSSTSPGRCRQARRWTSAAAKEVMRFGWPGSAGA